MLHLFIISIHNENTRRNDCARKFRGCSPSANTAEQQDYRGRTGNEISAQRSGQRGCGIRLRHAPPSMTVSAGAGVVR
jgi:hypothetical protein